MPNTNGKLEFTMTREEIAEPDTTIMNHGSWWVGSRVRTRTSVLMKIPLLDYYCHTGPVSSLE